jgi:hypothetical protein
MIHRKDGVRRMREGSKKKKNKEGRMEEEQGRVIEKQVGTKHAGEIGESLHLSV